jgi:prefoldin subunit 5
MVMDSFTVSQWIHLVITLMTIAIGGVWVVGSIKTTTAVLASKIEQLGKAIESLQIVCRTMTIDHQALAERVSKLETKVDAARKRR